MTLSAGEALRQARRGRGWSQRRLAAQATVAQPAIARIESGAVVPGIGTLEHLLGACGYGLECVRRPGGEIDRSVMRELLELTPRQRLDLAVEEALNLGRMLAASAGS
jgi:XRE family transcriptional regulator, regulator of sulfur utilization